MGSHSFERGPVPQDPTACKDQARHPLLFLSTEVDVLRREILTWSQCQCSTHELTTSRHSLEKWLWNRGLAVYRRAVQMLLRKEVIQPHLPVRLPCYDLVLITDPTFDGSLQKVGPPASGVTDFHDLTGGVYKARERIHRSVADLRLLATPTS